MNKKLHLVGSVPLPTAEDSMRLCAEHIGSHLAAMPDGEPGDRIAWRNFIAANIYHGHPQIETLEKPATAGQGGIGLLPTKYGDDKVAHVARWRFRLKDANQPLEFQTLGYAAEALASWEVFRKLRSTGAIGRDVRFQVSLPLTESGTCHYFSSPDEYTIVRRAYQAAMRSDIERMLKVIPAGDLAIQWDVCWEILAVEKGEQARDWSAPGDAFARYVGSLAPMCAFIPADVHVGHHYCYGDMHHTHFMQPPDLAASVRMANAAAKQSGRRLDFIHVTVPADRKDDAYFAPLSGLDIGKARVYVGLLHYHDGVDGSLERLATCRRHLKDFGIATECGFGRRPPEQVKELLDIHRRVAEAM